MMIPCSALKNALERPVEGGRKCLLWAVLAVALPTVLRMAVDDHVTGVAFSPYIPFVLLTALMLGWRFAAPVAFASVAIADLMFIDPRYVPIAGPTDVFGMVIFLLTATLIIFLVEAARSALAARPRPIPCGRNETGLIFSLEEGQALLSWSGSNQPLRLGPESEVSEMMRDFLAQLEVGRRLNAR